MLRKARVLFSARGRLLAHAVLLLGCVRLGLTLLPFRWMQKIA